MILSHGRKFIVFKTRKTAGTSFEIALSKYLGGKDIATPIAPADERIRTSLGHAGPQNFESSGVPGAKFYNHIGAQEVRSMVPAEVYDGYTKVAIVRNPFDHAVSWYFWEQSRVRQTSREDFRRWLTFQFQRRADIEADYRRRLRPNPGVFPSNRLITHIGETCAMDMMLRYEQFRDDATTFARRVGLPESLADEFGAIRAKGNYRPASATAAHMFSDFGEGQEMIRAAFAEEIDRFGYGLG